MWFNGTPTQHLTAKIVVVGDSAVGKVAARAALRSHDELAVCTRPACWMLYAGGTRRTSHSVRGTDHLLLLLPCAVVTIDILSTRDNR